MQYCTVSRQAALLSVDHSQARNIFLGHIFSTVYLLKPKFCQKTNFSFLLTGPPCHHMNEDCSFIDFEATVVTIETVVFTPSFKQCRICQNSCYLMIRKNLDFKINRFKKYSNTSQNCIRRRNSHKIRYFQNII